MIPKTVEDVELRPVESRLVSNLFWRWRCGHEAYQATDNGTCYPVDCRLNSVRDNPLDRVWGKFAVKFHQDPKGKAKDHCRTCTGTIDASPEDSKQEDGGKWWCKERRTATECKQTSFR